MTEAPFACVLELGPARIFVADSITYFTDCASDDVIVCGSHGGETAALFGAASGAKGLILNDAGTGKENAGIYGLQAVEVYGVAAATVGHMSAQIGNGRDTWDSGVVSHCNRLAVAAGVAEGQSVEVAARLLADWAAPAARQRPRTPADRPPWIIRDGLARVLALDSASMVNAEHTGAIVITGSHGGMTGGRAVRAAVSAAFFNDAGLGKNDAGLSRLPLLDRDGIAGGTVDCWSARIGDGRDSYESGVLSHINDAAVARGLRSGMPLRDAIDVLLRTTGGMAKLGEEADDDALDGG